MSFQLDPLTGLLNRAIFADQLQNLVSQSSGSIDSPFSLAFLDIDNLKIHNDQLGHQAGDEIIRAVAQRINAVMGENAYIARFGGDEYAVLLPGVDREQAFLMLEHVRADLESNPVVLTSLPDRRASVTVSAGIAAFPVDGRTEYELLRQADQAMYRAKKLGKNNVRLSYGEKMVAKTSHYTITQLERLSELAKSKERGEPELLREAVDDLLIKYGFSGVDQH